MQHGEHEAELAALRAAFAGRRLGPPCGWPAVHAFEAAHGVVLPEPYRSFVAEVGDGCPDGPPHHGLVRLDDYSQTIHPGAHGALARAFPLIAGWSWNDDPRPDAEVDPLLEAVLTDGTLHLGTFGCAIDWQLVVSGEHRGHVWLFTEDAATPFGRGLSATCTTGLRRLGCPLGRRTRLV